MAKVHCKYHSSTFNKPARVEVREDITNKTHWIPVQHLDNFAPKDTMMIRAAKIVLGNPTSIHITKIDENEFDVETI